MNDKIYPQGIRTFDPQETAPEFIVGTLIIEPKTLMDWLKENPNLLTEYKGKKQLKLTILKAREGRGVYTKVDTYKPEKKESPFGDPEKLPF